MSRYVIGIDLGTTNSALAYADSTEAAGDGPGPVERLPIPQVVALNDVSETASAPFVSVPSFPQGVSRRGARAALEIAVGPRGRVIRARPWRQGTRQAGRLGQELALAPRRRPALADSALDCASTTLPRISPVDASSAFLEHLRDAWNARNRRQGGRRAARESRGLPDRPRLVRPRRARADDRGRHQGRSQECHAARRAAGCVLRLARSPGRKMAQEASRPATSSWCATSAAGRPTSP